MVSEFIELRAPCNIDISTKLRFTTLLLRVTIIIKFCKFVLLDIAKSQFLLTRQNQIGGGVESRYGSVLSLEELT
ncbi:MAG: hypothetical protein RLZZ339_297 [Cyanobacteriota bacterium]